MRTTLAFIALGALLLTGCSAEPVAERSDREVACDNVYAFNDEYGDQFGSASASEVAGLATKLADATGDSTDLAALRVAAKLVAQTAVDIESASQIDVQMYSSAMNDLVAQLTNAQQICSS